VSAIQGVTDSLIEFMSEVRQEEDVQRFIRELRDRHVQILADVAGSMYVKQQAVNLLSEKLVRLERTLYGITYLEELTPQDEGPGAIVRGEDERHRPIRHVAGHGGQRGAGGS
jgi:aspartokinase